MALFDLSHKAIEDEWNQKAKALLVFRVGKFFLMYLKMPYGLICESLGLAIQIVCKAKNCSFFDLHLVMKFDGKQLDYKIIIAFKLLVLFSKI